MQRTVPIERLLAQREWVHSLARRLVRDENDADDLEQQAWVDALRSPPARDAGIRGWFGSILRRRARDAWRGETRRTRRETAAARPEGGRSTGEIVAEAEAHRLVVQAVLDLEEPYRETILLRFFESLAPAEVARRQGVPVETVRTRCRRGIERLREALDEKRGGRAAWMALVLPLSGERGWGPGAVAAAGAAAAAGMAGGAAVGTKVAVAVVFAAAGVLAGVGGTILLREEGAPVPPSPPPVADAPEPEVAVRQPDPFFDPPAPEPEPPPPAPDPSPPPPPPEPARPVLKGRVTDERGRGVSSVDIVVFREDGPVVPPPDVPPFARESKVRKESDVREAFLRQVREDKGKSSVSGRTESDGTFLLELPCEGTFRLLPWSREKGFLTLGDGTLEGLRAGAVVHLQCLEERDAFEGFFIGSRPAAEKLRLLRMLRGSRLLEGKPGGRAAAALLAEAKDPGLRADVLLALRGIPLEGLAPQLVTLVRGDSSEVVRAAAAAVLGDYLGEEAVVEALQESRDRDASERVREKAARSLRDLDPGEGRGADRER